MFATTKGTKLLVRSAAALKTLRRVHRRETHNFPTGPERRRTVLRADTAIRSKSQQGRNGFQRFSIFLPVALDNKDRLQHVSNVYIRIVLHSAETIGDQNRMLHTYVRRLGRPSRNLSSNLPSVDSCYCCCCYHNGNRPETMSRRSVRNFMPVVGFDAVARTISERRGIRPPRFPWVVVVSFPRFRLASSTDSPCPTVRRICVPDNFALPYGLHGFAYTGPGH